MNTESKVLVAIAAVITVAASVLLVVAGGGSDSKEAEVKDPGKLVRSDSIQSSPGAKVTVVEFGDLQCPACKQAEPTLAQIEKKYGKKVNIVWRHFPLSTHQNAVNAANASEAANQEGKFFEYKAILFQNQEAWSSANLTTVTNLFASYAGKVGVSGDSVKKAVQDQRFKAKIEKDMADGNQLGVASTPTFYVNGQQVPTDSLLQAVADALK